jgi:TolB-like protein
MISLGAGYYDAGSVELNWIENDEVMTQNVSLQRDTLVLLSYEHPLFSNLYAGVTVKGANSEIAERSSASAYAGDMGVFYLPLPNLTVSLALRNMGSSTKFIEKENPLPTLNYIGMGYVWRRGNFHLLTGAGVTDNTQDNEQFPEAGIEMGFGNISLNFGYSSNVDEANIHTGIQFAVRNVVIGYAYLPGVYLAPTNRFTIGYRFSPSAPAADSNAWPRYQSRIPMDMAVAQFSAKGLSQSNASNIADYLRVELAKNVQFDVVDRTDMKCTLETGYFKQPGCTAADCAVEFGKLLNVKQVIMGAVSKTAGIYYLNVNVVNVKDGIIKHTYTQHAESLKLLRASCQGLIKKISDAWAIDSKPPQPVKKDSKKNKSAK